jgi:hypothetical protein
MTHPFDRDIVKFCAVDTPEQIWNAAKRLELAYAEKRWGWSKPATPAIKEVPTAREIAGMICLLSAQNQSGRFRSRASGGLLVCRPRKRVLLFVDTQLVKPEHRT